MIQYLLPNQHISNTTVLLTQSVVQLRLRTFQYIRSSSTAAILVSIILLEDRNISRSWVQYHWIYHWDSFILSKSIKWLPGISGDFLVKSKLSLRSGSIALKQFNLIHEKGPYNASLYVSHKSSLFFFFKLVVVLFWCTTTS